MFLEFGKWLNISQSKSAVGELDIVFIQNYFYFIGFNIFDLSSHLSLGLLGKVKQVKYICSCNQ